MDEAFTPQEQTGPVVEGGLFTIDYLTPDISGFEITTRQTMRRSDVADRLPADVLESRSRENIKFRLSVIYPHNGETAQDVADRLLSRRLSNGKPELKPSDIEIQDGYVRLKPGFNPLIGPRNIVQEGSNLSMDVLPVTFPTYQSIDRADESRERQDLSTPGATAAILLTTEPSGSHKIIIQNRSLSNANYPGVAGASIAGMLDAELDTDHKNRGKIKPLTTDWIKRNNLKEMDEEFGLKPEELESVVITGISTDKLKYHKEFMLWGVLNISSEELAGRVNERAGENRSNDLHDFEGKFFTIDASPQAINTLLTAIKCPAPTSHAAAFAAAGYYMILQNDGSIRANEWIQRLASGIQQNYNQIDAIVAAYKDDPEAKYDPNIPPDEQGLPGLEAELKRTGLVS